MKQIVFNAATGESYEEDYIPDAVEAIAAPRPQSTIVASVGVVIADGQVSALEFPANIQSAVYEPGWLMLAFSEPQEDDQYQVFLTMDYPAKTEQYKYTGYFELVLTDSEGNPVEPSRADIQILRVR